MYQLYFVPPSILSVWWLQVMGSKCFSFSVLWSVWWLQVLGSKCFISLYYDLFDDCRLWVCGLRVPPSGRGSSTNTSESGNTGPNGKGRISGEYICDNNDLTNTNKYYIDPRSAAHSFAGSVKSWPALSGIICPDIPPAEETYLNSQLFACTAMAGYTVNIFSHA